MKYPVKKLVVPQELLKYGNGKIPLTQLRRPTGGGLLYKTAARAWSEMVAAAAKDGVKLVRVSTGYRSYASQEKMFRDRYADKNTGRVPAVTRMWQGRRWWLKKGKSPSATPGKSNHGWGLAQDVNVQNPAVFNWLVRNAPKFGFYLQGQKTLPDGKPNPEWEAWHWQYCP